MEYSIKPKILGERRIIHYPQKRIIGLYVTNMLTLQESIRPSADLRNHYAEISKQCKENKEAVIITVNGRGDTVALSYEEYKNMKARIELLEVLAEAEDDVKNERVAPITETFDDLRKMLQEDNDEV
jgi:prevent-host-death family protein